ncbi:hypothetical protein ACYFX5_26895 [Bremerella sp. T1]|uniref:hypothetical protein n=1 Tax=Bremerella sp. TYQ1 TaxID=3119568 RepID=UPI001CCF540D|nr:hypothetical protein [Bremerella volcania]UBM36638.1 hypothetical protein LA756_01750 [Bremerella volcania]
MFGWFKKKTRPTSGPDFTDIDSLAKAEELYREGKLEKLFLMPLEFGGEDNPLNTLYVPVGVAGIKNQIDVDTIGALIESGTVTQYQPSPQYQGKSFIPIAIEIVASAPGSFSTTINIWGDALSRD